MTIGTFKCQALAVLRHPARLDPPPDYSGSSSGSSRGGRRQPTADVGELRSGAPREIRTPDRLLRRQLLFV